MLISYYANKKSSPRLPSWQPSLIFFNIPIESGSIIKPCTLKHFQVTYRLHKAGYWTIGVCTWRSHRRDWLALMIIRSRSLKCCEQYQWNKKIQQYQYRSVPVSYFAFDTNLFTPEKQVFLFDIQVFDFSYCIVEAIHLRSECHKGHWVQSI